MRRRGESQIGKRIARETVRPALQEDKLRRLRPEVRESALPRRKEIAVTCARIQREIELGPRGCAPTALVRMAGSGVKEVPTLVNVHDAQAWIRLIGVIDAVPVMHIDVHIRNSLYAEFRPQCVDHHTEIVEHAEPGGLTAASMVQAADGLKGLYSLSRHDSIKALEGGSGHHRSGIEDARESRGVARVEIPFAGTRSRFHPIDVLGGVKSLELRSRGWTRITHDDSTVQILLLRGGPEGGLAIDAQRVPGRKSVLRQRIAHEQNEIFRQDASPR